MNTSPSILSRESWVSEKDMHCSFVIQKPQQDYHQMFKKCGDLIFPQRWSVGMSSFDFLGSAAELLFLDVSREHSAFSFKV